MAQGIGSILGGPIASLIRAETGSWMPVFGLIIAMDLITAILAFAVLKPDAPDPDIIVGSDPGSDGGRVAPHYTRSPAALRFPPA